MFFRWTVPRSINPPFYFTLPRNGYIPLSEFYWSVNGFYISGWSGQSNWMFIRIRLNNYALHWAEWLCSALTIVRSKFRIVLGSTQILWNGKFLTFSLSGNGCWQNHLVASNLVQPCKFFGKGLWFGAACKFFGKGGLRSGGQHRSFFKFPDMCIGDASR